MTVPPDSRELGPMRTAKTIEPTIESISDRELSDREQLAKLGKKSVLKVEFPMSSSA
jgi:hypothetical protein